MNLLQVPAYVIALGGVVSALVSATKGGIEQLMPASNKWHDLCFTLYPIVLALALMVGYTLTHGGDVFWSVVWGLLAGAWGLGTYTLHTRTGTTVSSVPLTVSPQAPAPIDLSLPLSDPRQPAWAAQVVREATGATAGTAQPSVTAPPPPAAADPVPQAPARVPSAPDAAWTSTTVRYEPPAAPVAPSVADEAGPPTP